MELLDHVSALARILLAKCVTMVREKAQAEVL
jgi:hypothetical protein